MEKNKGQFKLTKRRLINSVLSLTLMAYSNQLIKAKIIPFELDKL